MTPDMHESAFRGTFTMGEDRERTIRKKSLAKQLATLDLFVIAALIIMAALVIYLLWRLIVVIIIIAAAYYIYRWYKRKKAL